MLIGYGDFVGTFYDGTTVKGFVATVVPEPISSTLFIIGAGVLAGRRFIRRKK